MTKSRHDIRLATRRPGRFPHASMGSLVWLTIVWVMLWGELSAGNFMAGFLLALLVTTVVPFPFMPFDGRFRPLGVLWLVLHFIWDLFRASFMQARFILSRKHPKGAIIRVRLRSRSDVYLAMTAGITGLVPGSVVVDVHRASATLYVHVFDTRLAGGIAGVHRCVLAQEELILRAFASHDELLAAGYVPGSSKKAGRLPTPYAPETTGLTHNAVSLERPALRVSLLDKHKVSDFASQAWIVPEAQSTLALAMERIAGNRLQGERASNGAELDHGF